MRLLAIDGNSILNRAFYGIKLLTTKDGRYTNAIFGFMNILLKQLEDLRPDGVAIAFDRKEKTFRHQMYDGYKATRKGMPEELAGQLPLLKDLLEHLGYRILEAEGYEADDILGTLARICGEQQQECAIVTGDRDSLQLVRPQVKVYLATTKMGRPQTEVYDEERIQQEYHIPPQGMIDLKALMGDSSDCIPGVAGIGLKTASGLLEQYQSLDYLYDNLDTLPISPGVKKKLEADRDMAFLSWELGRIFCEVPLEENLSDYQKKPGNPQKAAVLLADLEMFSLIDRLGLQNTAQPLPAVSAPTSCSAGGCYSDDLSALAGIQGTLYFTPREAGGWMVSAEGTIYPLSSDFEPIRAILSDSDVPKVAYHSKQLKLECLKQQISLEGVVSDPLLSAYLLNPSASGYSLPNLLLEYNISQEKLETAPEGEREELERGAALPLLDEKLNSLIEENGQRSLLQDIELPLALVLADMEYAGMEVDPEGLRKFGVELEGRIGDIEASVYQAAGEKFNLNSPKQLGHVLFDLLGLPVRKKTKTGYSTNAEVLESLMEEHPIIPQIMEYRQLAKLKSTYCDALLKVVGEDGRIHSTFNQTEARTGRLSSLDPNLQNIPIRQEVGRNLRRFFRAKEGFLLVDADYSQVELRVLAHMAQDSIMLEAFNNEEDIHTITASQVFRVPPEEVTPFMRSSAKAVNFGIVYGIGAFSLAVDIGVSRAQADQYIRAYLEKYAGVAAYMETVVRQAKESGYVTTLFGRRRYLPELTSSNRNMRNFGERVALNMPIQGTAADIIKIAMIRVSDRLRRDFPEARLIMQVHDELIVEAPQHQAEQVAALLKEEMEQACRLDVLLKADVHWGKTWYDAKG